MEHKVEEVKLKCGAKGLLIDVPGAPVVAMEVWFRGGDAYTEYPEKMETAHIMEHLAFGANSEQASMAEVSRYVSKNGAWSNASTSRNFLSYKIGAPDFDLERLLKQLILQITKPKFLEKEFEAEFGNVQEELKQRSNNRWDELSAVMMQKFGWDCYETDLERLGLMDNVGIEGIKEHYKKVHSPQNAVFFVAGDIKKKRDTIIDTLEDLGGLKSGSKLALPADPDIKSFDKSPVVIAKEDVSNVYFSLEAYALSDESRKEKDSLSLSVLNVVLSHEMHSRIFGKARQAGWIYSLDCGRSVNSSGLYSWEIYAQVGRDNIDNVLDLIVKELRDVKENGLTKEEVEEAKLAIKGSLRMSNQKVSDILGFYKGHYNSREVEEIRYFSEADSWVDSVTPESIQELFLNLIKTKKWGAGFLGNVTEKDAAKWNKKLAEIFED